MRWLENLSQSRVERPRIRMLKVEVFRVVLSELL